MFDEKQDVLWERARDAVTSDLALQLQRFRVGHSAEWYGP
jgi:hypothetical protein